MEKLARIRHSDIFAACHEYNAKIGVKYPEKGTLLFGDFRGDGGRLRRKLYAITNDQGGITCIFGSGTLRAKLAYVQDLINRIQKGET